MTGAPGKARILVVDDEAVILTLLESVLTEEGYDVAVAKSCEAAESMLAHGPWQLLITDKNLEGESGVNLAHVARAMVPDISVVLMTGYATEESATELLRLGIDDYISKPFDLPDLTRRVREIMDLRERVANTPQATVASAAGRRVIALAVSDEADAAVIRSVLTSLSLEHIASTDILATLQGDEPMLGAIVSYAECTPAVRSALMDYKLAHRGFRFVLVQDKAGLGSTVEAILIGAVGALTRPLSDGDRARTALADAFTK